MVNATDGTRLLLLCEQCHFPLGDEREGGLVLRYKKFECRLVSPAGVGVICPRCLHQTRFGLTRGGQYTTLHT